MIINVLVAASYFYFNWRYFRMATAVLGMPRMPKLPVVAAFFVNYALFYLCSVLEFNLLVNWALFFLFLLGESFLYCRKGWRVALFFALNGILYGLTINIFCRCAVSIVTAQPLVDFDNHISNIGNLKALPVLLGFLLGGAVLHLMSRPKIMERFQTLISHPGHLAFQLELMAGMFLYLFLNLLLYQSPGDSVLLKLWGIKSCVFSLTGAVLGMRYSLQMCRMSDYREQNRAIRQELVQKALEERELRSAAYRDILTGAYNRQYIMDQLGALLAQRADFVLCFLDMDDLKGVNDGFGHTAGDQYLAAVARELEAACRDDGDMLARYGGDEFLLLFPDAAPEDVEARILQADLRLREMSGSDAAPFPMSVSFGLAKSGDAQDAEGLIAVADREMYGRKQEKRGV